MYGGIFVLLRTHAAGRIYKGSCIRFLSFGMISKRLRVHVRMKDRKL